MVTNAFFLLAFHWEEHCFLQSLIEFPLSWYKVETGIAAALAPNRTFGTTEKIRPWDIALLVDLWLRWLWKRKQRKYFGSYQTWPLTVPGRCREILSLLCQEDLRREIEKRLHSMARICCVWPGRHSSRETPANSAGKQLNPINKCVIWIGALLVVNFSLVPYSCSLPATKIATLAPTCIQGGGCYFAEICP